MNSDHVLGFLGEMMQISIDRNISRQYLASQNIFVFLIHFKPVLEKMIFTKHLETILDWNYLTRLHPQGKGGPEGDILCAEIL